MATSIDMAILSSPLPKGVLRRRGRGGHPQSQERRVLRLNPIGARIWNLIQEPRQVAQLQDQLLSEYEVDPARLATDVRELLADLAEHGLIEVQH